VKEKIILGLRLIRQPNQTTSIGFRVSVINRFLLPTYKRIEDAWLICESG